MLNHLTVFFFFSLGGRWGGGSGGLLFPGQHPKHIHLLFFFFYCRDFLFSTWAGLSWGLDDRKNKDSLPRAPKAQCWDWMAPGVPGLEIFRVSEPPAQATWLSPPSNPTSNRDQLQVNRKGYGWLCWKELHFTDLASIREPAQGCSEF